jgi:anti-sigma B factor antagonist
MILEVNRRDLADGIGVIELSGRLVLGTSGQSAEWKLQSAVGEGVRKLVIDLSRLTAIDSMGIGVLVMLAGKLRDAGGVLKLSGAEGTVAHSLQIVQIDRIVELFTDAATAIASFRATGDATSRLPVELPHDV